MSDIDDFDLDRSIDEGWDHFVVRLSEVLSVMDEGATLTITALDAGLEPDGPGVAFRSAKLGEITAEIRGAEPTDLRTAGWPNDGASTWSQEKTDDLANLVVRILRDVIGVTHPVFLTTDDPAGLLEPPAPPAEWTSPAAEPALDAQASVAVIATDRGELDTLVIRQLATVFGQEPVRDTDGDHAIRVGSTMVFVRVVPDCREIIVFAPLVHEVAGRSRAAEVLNDLNAESRWVRFAMIRDRVFGSMSVLARPFVPAHLQQAVKEVAAVADAIDENLAETLKGRTTF
ncbi:MAG TPA: hypothetical protein PLA44_07745 [Propionibacteriaceae bacterium]|nr:hypothetical protein [Propionibacteriaceae bacterium]